MASNLHTLAAELAKQLADEGKLIEAGWIVIKTHMPAGASEAQIKDMRNAYFCGAQHLFASIMGILDPGEDPTMADLKRMDLINNELGAFRIGLQKNEGWYQ